MKVTVVGGGSTYTPELVDGLLRRRAELDLHEIVLADIDPDRLRVVGGFARRMVERVAGDRIAVTLTDDLASGVERAGAVVNQVRVGRNDARRRDELLGRELGLIGQETVGIGGFANALRTIPVALGLAEVVADRASDAHLLNFANPAGVVTEALCRHGAHPTIGLCNVPWSTKALVAGAFAAEAADVDLDVVGLNHLTWTRRVVVAGTDRTTEALAMLAALHPETLPDDPSVAPTWTRAGIELLGALPNPYLTYYTETAAWVAHQAVGAPRADEVAEVESRLLARYADVALDTAPPELAERGGAHYSEAAAALLADLVSGAGVDHVVNVPNAGAIPGLPDDWVVEVSARVEGGRATPRPTEPLRPDVDALVRTMKDVELLTIAAAVHGDHDAARRALLVHPLGPPAHRVDQVWQRLREVHAGWLGRLDA